MTSSTLQMVASRKSSPTGLKTSGCSSKFSRRGYPGFDPWFHLPRLHFGTIFLRHSHLSQMDRTSTTCNRTSCPITSKHVPSSPTPYHVTACPMLTLNPEPSRGIISIISHPLYAEPSTNTSNHPPCFTSCQQQNTQIPFLS